jgi:hypothetical protein
MTKAACRGEAFKSSSRDIFFPKRGETSEEAILKFCFACDVRDDCEQYADHIGAQVGVWGGKRRTRSTHGSEAEKHANDTKVS